MTKKRILANDGIAQTGKDMLEKAGLLVETNKISQDELASKIGEYHAIIVRSATQVDASIIDAGKQLQVIGRAGVGLDNIDLTKAENNNVKVVNTPGASSRSVAELVMTHALSLSRNIFTCNRELPKNKGNDFKSLKKSSRGTEVFGKTIAIVGFGQIGQKTASLALGMGMKVIAVDPYSEGADIPFAIHPELELAMPTVFIKTMPLASALAQADIISLHVPAADKPLISDTEFKQMKNNAILINCARGGIVNEKALISALDNNEISYSALDVFEAEPPLNNPILTHSKVSLSPHIGGNTQEAQERIGIELAEKIIKVLA